MDTSRDKVIFLTQLEACLEYQVTGGITNVYEDGGNLTKPLHF